LVCPLKRRIAKHPFDLVHRARRTTGLPVCSVPIPAKAAPGTRGWTRLRRGECALSQPLTAWAR
jgi:hypothetical protein